MLKLSARQRPPAPTTLRLSCLLLALLLPAALTGCGAGSLSQQSVHSVALTGKVYGGQQPVSNSLVQLWAAGTTAGGSAGAVAPVNLIATGQYYLGGSSGCTPSSSQTCYSGVYTDSHGGFTLTGDYTCPSATAQVYLTVKGGNPGLNPAVDNAALLMMDPLGSCGNLTPATDIFIDEVTTAATAWALAPFLDANGDIVSSPTNTAGLANAFLNARLLADPGTGMASTSLNSYQYVETGKLYALANTLSNCVNSDGTVGCQPLFLAATPANGTAPANTLAAALNVVRYPAQNVAAVFNAAAAQPPFPSLLSSVPNDWTMSLTITGGGLSYPSALDVDAFGNVWVANYFGVLSGFSPQGTALTPNGYSISGGDEVYGLTIDTTNNIWVTNEEQPYHGKVGSATIFNGAATGGAMGSYLNGSQFVYGYDTDFPESMSADANGNVFVANYGNSSASVFNGSGVEVTGGIGANGGAAFPVAISGDVTNGVASHGVWLANQGDDTVSHFDQYGNLLARVNCCNGASGVATDSFGNAWISNYYGKSVSEVSNANAILIDGDTQGGVSYPANLVVDAGQNVWIANYRGSSFTEIAGNSNALPAGTGISPSTGFGRDAFLVDPYSIVVDASGNLWVTSFNANSVTMFFGLATPTATPIVPVPTAP